MLSALQSLYAKAAVLECTDSTDSHCTDLPHAGGDLNQILQIAIAVAAALAVLFVVIGGLRLITSAGDPNGTAKARSTIIYALVGLVIAILAEVIVAFAIKEVG